MIQIEQASMIAVNIVLGIAALIIVRRVMRKWIKQDVLEALREHEAKQLQAGALSRAQEIRRKYGW